MQYYFAPMEGLTDSIYRSLHYKFFPGVHRYYTPFFSPTVHRSLTPKERRELVPAETLSFQVVPQILTKNPEDFIWMAAECQQSGYREVNLNLGCPSGTVTAKGKGSGALRELGVLDSFLAAVFHGSPLPVSIKTRIGYYSEDEFPAILEVLNQYPIKELIIHPRTRTDFYKGPVHMNCFHYAEEHSKNPLCFNGNLCSTVDIAAFSTQFPQVGSVMLGRGLVSDPGMLTPGGTDIHTLHAFHDALFAAYTEAFGSRRNAISRMKENWHYLICRFSDGERLFKKLRKSTDPIEFQAITEEIFTSLSLNKQWTPCW